MIDIDLLQEELTAAGYGSRSPVDVELALAAICGDADTFTSHGPRAMTRLLDAHFVREGFDGWKFTYPPLPEDDVGCAQALVAIWVGLS